MAGLAAVMLLLVGAGSAAGSADTGTDAQAVGTLDLPKPAWLTDELEAQIVAAGPKGVEIARPDATVNPDCLGTAPPYVDTDGVSTTAVSAGTCMVSPSGCTMNFVFTDGTSYYIGTAGHCSGNGKTVIAQVGTRVDPTDTVFVTLAAIGTTVASWNSGIGKDFALVKINAGFKVIPGVTGALGPTGVFCGDPVGQPVMHYGHGYIFFVEQGYPKFGEVIPDLTLLVKFTTPDGFNWVGYGLPGDSGSEVMNDAGLAVGDLTHGIGIAGVPVPGLSFGTDMSEIFALIGSSYQLVTVDGRTVSCANPLGL
ncbi:MAG: hypothetical protein AUH17_03695 [Actinobacteria bacterium 13_2_20CM_68_14]|nr:MAG: hypothetical protein AUH17_03695 [Actinobacteria bacterium 13_2_20CM_68_14]